MSKNKPFEHDDVISKLISERPAENEPTEVDVGLQECVDTIFFDHATNEWGDLAEHTYHKSEQQGLILRAFEESLWTENNLLIVGNSGHGKTTVLKKVLHELKIKLSNKTDLLCEYLNLRPLGPVVSDDAITAKYNEILIQILEHYDRKPSPDSEQQISSPILTGKLNRAIQSIEIGELTDNQKAVIFVIDDVDYIEHDLHRPILEKLRPLLNSTNVTVVWACRPPALMELEYEFTNQSKNPFITVSPIEVTTPPIQDVILSRVWPFIDVLNSSPAIVDKIGRFRERQANSTLEKSILDRLRLKLGKLVTPKLNCVPYPFGPRHENYILKASNGDLRVIFGMLGKIIDSIQKNNLAVQVRKNDTGDLGHPRIDRGPFLKAFGMGEDIPNPQLPQQERELWRVLNLFEVMNRNGRSPLLICVLEWIVIGDRMFSDDYYSQMQAIGFSKQQADEGADYCRSAKLIEPEAIKTGSYNLISASSGRDQWKWILTEKGSYYLREIINWPEYTYFIADYKSLFDKIPYNRLNCDLLELVGHFVYADRVVQSVVENTIKFQGSAGYLRIRKESLFRLFNEVYGTTYLKVVRLNGGNQIRKEKVISDETIARICTSISALNGNGKKLMRTAGNYFEIRRAETEHAVRSQEFRIPNHDQLIAEEYLEVVYEDAWQDRVSNNKFSTNETHEKIQTESLRILRESYKMPA